MLAECAYVLFVQRRDGFFGQHGTGLHGLQNVNAADRVSCGHDLDNAPTAIALYVQAVRRPQPGIRQQPGESLEVAMPVSEPSSAPRFEQADSAASSAPAASSRCAPR